MDYYHIISGPHSRRWMRRTFFFLGVAWLYVWLTPEEGASRQWIVALSLPTALYVLYRLYSRLSRERAED
jgi:hypothetical protein